MAIQDFAYGGLLDEMFVPQENRPKAVLFGDSISEFVGYNADGSPNGKYGASVADVIGNNLGISVTNLATGGETSNEALQGGSKFGAFADYIAQNRPEYAIIRYGAADAIKNQDPNITLQSIQQMVDIARANGVTPIIVGVSELYGSQNSKTGNIAGYIDPQAEQRASQINAGLAQIAANNGVAFTDVRAMTSAGDGDLLDGVHTNADFGKKMADAISESIVEQGAIQGIRVPQLPPNVEALSPQEKGRLYNQLIDQGYSDAQIRTAAKAESDQDWNALRRIAAEVKNTTPGEIERRTAQSSQTPDVPVISPPQQAAQATQMVAQPAPEDLTEFVFSRMSPAEMNAYTMLRESGVNEMLPLTTIDGKSYFQNSDGSIVEIKRTGPTGANQTIYSAGGEVVEQAELPNYGATSYSDIIGNAAIAAITGGMFGPAGAGLLSSPSAAALGSGLTTLGRTGDIEQALQGAAVGALGAYGAEQAANVLNNLSYNTAFAAADAAQLANQGLDAAAIAQNLSTYVDPATATSLANTAANQAFALADATQLTQQGLSVDQVTQVLQSSGVNPGVAASAAQAAADGVTELSATDIVSNIRFQPQQQGAQQGLLAPESVTVTGERIASGGAAVPGVTSGLLSAAAPVQQVAVTAAPSPAPAPAAQAGGVLSQVVPVTAAPAPAPAPEQAGGLLGAIPPQTVPVTAAPVAAPAAPEQVGGLLGQVIPPQTVPVTAAPAPQAVTPEAAGSILSALTGSPVSVGDTQTVQVTGQGPGQTVTPEAAGALLSSVIGQTVVVSDSTIPPSTTPTTVGSVAGTLAPTQTVPVTGTNIPVTGTPTTVGSVVGSIPTQTVPVSGTPIPPPSAAPETVGGLLGTIPAQTVTVEDRYVPPPAPAPVLPSVPTQSVVVGGTTIPTATVNIPTTAGAVAGGAGGGAGGAGGSASANNQLNVGLLDAAGMAALLGGINAIVNRPAEPSTFDQAYSNIITGAGRPSLGGQAFVPYSNFFQIQPTTVYNPFATTAPFGAGRFGAVNQPITLPRPIGLV